MEPNVKPRRGRREVSLPGETAINASVSELASVVVAEVQKAARGLLGDLDPSDAELALHLTQLQIMDAFNKSVHDETGIVAAARHAGGTWEQIGAALGMTKQAAYERWSKPVKVLDEGAAWSKAEAEKAEDPLVEFLPMLHLEKPEQPKRRRRRT